MILRQFLEYEEAYLKQTFSFAFSFLCMYNGLTKIYV